MPVAETAGAGCGSGARGFRDGHRLYRLYRPHRPFSTTTGPTRHTRLLSYSVTASSPPATRRPNRTAHEEAALARAFHRRYPHPPRPLPRPPRDASEGTCALNSRRRPGLSSGACTPQSRRRREVCGTRSSVSSEPPPPPPSPPPPSRASPPTSPSSSSRRRTSACPGDATHRGSSSRVHAAGSRKGSDADAP